MATYAIEKLDNAFLDLQSMLPAQWEHTGDPEVPCMPNWGLYRQLEQHEAAFLVIARDEGRPVGYMTAFVYPHPNAVTVLTGEIKTYYVEKGRPLLLKSLIDFTLQELARRHVFKVKAWTHAGHSAARIWELMGFAVTDIGFTMKLRGKTDA
jgi:hypothetical protein